jgi:16S rRNA processing protein RimM
VGTLSRAHGIRGEIKAVLDHASSTLFAKVNTLMVLEGAVLREYLLLSARPMPSCSLLHLGGVTTRDQAEAMQGKLIYVKKESLPPTEPDEIYLYQLEGKKVITLQQEVIGVVDSFIETNAKTPVMVVRGAKGEYLLPVIPDVVLEVNEETNTVTIDLLEGFEPT